MATIYISLGSNIDPHSNLCNAITALGQCFESLALSPVYQSPAVGMDAGDFLNAAASAETLLSAEQVVHQLRAIEDQNGRDRTLPKFSSRTLDLDLLLYNDLVQDTSALALPRAEIVEQAFVLQPLVDIAADLEHPVTGEPLSVLLAGLKRSRPEQFASLTMIDLRPPI